MSRLRQLLPALLAFGLASPLAGSVAGGGFGLSVLVDGAPRPEFPGHGAFYVEAIRGREYGLRITNPLPVRVAVALSVDGLNTIDSRHTDAASARKWVLGPYESVVISGWQVSGEAARRFYFTGERSSYGARLGQTEDLGVIEAVFFREKEPYRQAWQKPKDTPGPFECDAGAPKARAEAGAAAPESAAKLSDDYAATGMGGRTRHAVTEVSLDLEPAPVAMLRIRYEFRPILEKLGVLPRAEDPLERRERSHGFGPFCPER
ncbi:MAG TPA: hypothetical protein VL084_14780 [Thermoanaerobaculia bacterium]|nr:hypothetical protein [Thermoanaerobaculia bacterium]